MRLRPALSSNPTLIKSHNFAPFRRFDGTLLSYVRQSTRLRTNPSKTSKIHQNSDFLGLGDPAGYCVPVGRRSKRAKDKQTIEMSLFGLSKICDVIRAIVDK